MVTRSREARGRGPRAPGAGMSAARRAARCWRPSGQRASTRPADSDRAAPRRPRRPKRPSRLGMLVGNWWNRLIGAVYSGSLSSQTEQYAAHNTTRDYIWNSVGLGAWGVVFPVLSVVTTQLVGVEQAGRFSMAFVTGTLLLFIANYGVRTFQVSDLSERHSFADYQANRALTCIVMMLVGILYCQLRGYDPQMFTLCMGMFAYRAVDGLADVYEGRLQQMDKLYLAGISQAIRSAAVIIAYCALILITRSIGAAGVAMAVASVASFVLLTLPLTYFETPKSAKLSIAGVRDLFVQCFPLFVALFLYNLIDNMPKFAMEGALSYDNQLYFNALFSPAHIIIMAIGFIYKPQLMRLAEIWADPKRRGRFDLIVLAVLAIIVALTGRRCRGHGHRGHPRHELPVWRGLRAVPRAVLRHGGHGRRLRGHRLPVPDHHGAPPPEGRHARLPAHAWLLAVHPAAAHRLHGTHGRRAGIPHRDVHPARAARNRVPLHPRRALGDAEELPQELGPRVRRVGARLTSRMPGPHTEDRAFDLLKLSQIQSCVR